ncbi:hypothetical protein [Acinetobacter baumannii]|uniref:hypothetical protein n=1 Tax=Acinetobacter baumannii TaxID=470 RepID=UPI00069077A4|nr:hypothetical protein [Acinetobacter baumannii]EHU1392748.1 hypothetical protein [Acinetobacter baumannii]KQD43450.1 hypothetical protein APD15_07580 [Acinetobacter baumannii]TPU51794.1 hypothetical protein FJV28_07930 [Acinetobacter baumannii]
MDNYKIINTHTNEIIKALNDLGYVWTPKKFDEQDCLLKAHWILAKETGEIAYSSGTHIDSPLVFTELTLPQLRDLVVLKRNDINDANWETEGGDQIFKDSNDKSFIYRSDGWDELLRHEMRQAMWEKPKAIAKPQDPALISGVEALADITKVQHAYNCSDDWFTTQYSTLTIPEILKGKTNCGHEIKFRVKPTTISINTELPKPEREFHQNKEIFSVTYEFKTREERNAFADKLRGTNS